MGTRALPSILSKGFFWFLSCSQSRNVKAVLSGQSVVREKCSLRGHIHQFGVNCPLGVCLTLWYYLSFFGKKEGFTDIAIPFCLFPLILYAEKYAKLCAGNLARLAHR